MQLYYYLFIYFCKYSNALRKYMRSGNKIYCVQQIMKTLTHYYQLKYMLLYIRYIVFFPPKGEDYCARRQWSLCWVLLLVEDQHWSSHGILHFITGLHVHLPQALLQEFCSWALTNSAMPLSLQVIVTLQGTEGECEPHHLTDPDKPVFERGGVDLFLLTTPFSLGELQSIRLWHDNSGDHPAW